MKKKQPNYYNTPTPQERLEKYRKGQPLRPDYMDKTPEKEEFTYHVKKCGGSSHIGLGKRWLGRFVKVNVEEIGKEE